MLSPVTVNDAESEAVAVPRNTSPELLIVESLRIAVNADPAAAAAPIATEGVANSISLGIGVTCMVKTSPRRKYHQKYPS